MIRGERLVDATKNSRPPKRGSITDVRGIRVGHWTDTANATGCTAVICDPAATAGVEVRGAAPGARETALLHPLAQASWVNAIVLAGGSAFGLDAATGAVRYLEEQGRGLRVGRATIPIVPAAILFDLGMITHRIRPTAEDGYAACCAAGNEFQTGSVGAGTGATIGGMRGRKRSVKGGIGTASVRLAGGATVGALVAVNPSGSIVDPSTGKVIAGPINEDGIEIRGLGRNTIDRSPQGPPVLQEYDPRGGRDRRGVGQTRGGPGRDGWSRRHRDDDQAVAHFQRWRHRVFPRYRRACRDPDARRTSRRRLEGHVRRNHRRRRVGNRIGRSTIGEGGHRR